MSRSEKRTRVIRVTDDGTRDARADMLATEEPLEIRVNGRRLAVTMRTPSEDFSLAAGFLLSEGVVTDGEQISSIRYCRKDFGPGAEDGDNTIDVVLQPWVLPPLPFQERNVMMSSACGMCGRTSIDQVHQKSQFSTSEDPLRLSEEFVLRMPQVLRDRQKVFDHTGGLHAAGLFDGRTGELVAVREDVGRHNAVDKVLGWALLEGKLPLRQHVLMVSGRASFELTQKCAMAGVPMLASVSAPSSLAVELAKDAGMTLAGFVRDHRFVIYSGDERIASDIDATEANIA
ncbi:formate dehydrogenase accessory sulfurtransferase FdhD [Kocuria sp. HSID16901]|mgnify:CR=1 FL=1|uniref:formate dehydrogenase accessory sulfurtransferase FdhD n=1 Tax=Kocuria sp. HSID16901 TaxID=2419505 RepID=UPI000660BA2C|nr:formate dehydrogenase accessory sulfurtransferase FdhD [Kocuria sp. HSID16901]MCT1367750.1 formate dehydrogenase accessory sulfurtransferase FdhD [Rothia sp. p3-SID1597]RUQ20300.1 formate dehydrogenase accessory sulfurtransferase FdhD [Kocuria sp. HSID16901]